MDKELEIIHTQDRHGHPLAVVNNFPGLYAEMYPAQMRGMANALIMAANVCESGEEQKRRFSTQRVVKYPICDVAAPT